jgi:F-type H+-transporting ATPase subunit a
MHGHHESWFTKLLNQYLAAPANSILHAVGKHPHDPAHPWADWMATQILVAIFLVAVAFLVRASLSMEKPGTLQQFFESIVGFVKGQADEIIGHHYQPHIPMVATLFLFIASLNLIGIIPAFESPTMFASVPAGCAIAIFLYFNYWGFKEQGVLGYLKHFAGPMLAISWFLFPLEIISLFVRPVSLTIRLFANMVAGEQVTMSFLALVPVIPVIFMGLHVFVSLLQAFIFMMLSLIYINGAVAHEDH